MQGVTRRDYARRWRVNHSAINKAIAAGTVQLHDDGSVDVAASDAVWGRRHEWRLAIYHPDALDPETLERIEAELARAREWLARTSFSAIPPRAAWESGA
jgi:hypothetical protein